MIPKFVIDVFAVPLSTTMQVLPSILRVKYIQDCIDADTVSLTKQFEDNTGPDLDTALRLSQNLLAYRYILKFHKMSHKVLDARIQFEQEELQQCLPTKTDERRAWTINLCVILIREILAKKGDSAC